MRIGLSVIGRRLLYAGAVAAGAGLVYAHFVEPRWIAVERWTVRVPGLPRAWEGLRAVQLSDLQAGSWRQDRNLVRRAIALALGERPDVIFLTGDFEDDGKPHDRGRLFTQLANVVPVYAVLGNHDHAAGPRATAGLVAGLESQGVQVLVNSHAWLHHKGEAWMVVGVDDLATGHTDFLQAITGIPRDTRMLTLLTHVPEVAEMAPHGWFPLALSGHTHGGQLTLPPWRSTPLLRLAPGMGRARYLRGWYEVNGGLLYVNRGIGTSNLPLRLGARPEVSLFVLTGGEALPEGVRWRRRGDSASRLSSR